MSNYVIFTDENGSPYLAHYGVKGQKWGIRRYQNPDGSLTAEGLKRYGNPDGTLNKKGIKALAKAEFRDKKRDINKRYYQLADKYEKNRSEILFGLDSGRLGERLKKHLKNEYEFSKRENKLDQERLDARREYRKKIGKKNVDNFLMKQYQKSIDEINAESQSEFNKRYAQELVSEFATLAYDQIRRNRAT